MDANSSENSTGHLSPLKRQENRSQSPLSQRQENRVFTRRSAVRGAILAAEKKRDLVYEV